MIGTVLVLGGGGFSVLDEASAIDDYLLQLTGKDDPKVCFVPTASGDADPYIERFLNAFQDRPTRTDRLRLFPTASVSYLAARARTTSRSRTRRDKYLGWVASGAPPSSRASRGGRP